MQGVQSENFDNGNCQFLLTPAFFIISGISLAVDGGTTAGLRKDFQIINLDKSSGAIAVFCPDVVIIFTKRQSPERLNV